MKAIVVDGDDLRWADHEAPTLGPGEVRIDIRASAINRADLAQRNGGYAPPPGASPIMGLECAGVVTEIGDGVTRVAVGDDVCALLAGGGYAEETVVPAGQVLHVPTGLSHVEAAALPEVFATAYLNLFMEASLQPGETALLHAGASGVGTAAIQMCREFGNPCFVTAGSAAKVDRCIELGASGGSNRHESSFEARVEEWTDGRGFDVILDPVGGSYLEANLKSLNLNGRLVLIGLMGGAKAETNLGLMMMKRLRVIGSTLRARPIPQKAAVMDALNTRVWPLIEAGTIKPIIEAEFPMEQAGDAQALIAGNETFGKVMLVRS